MTPKRVLRAALLLTMILSGSLLAVRGWFGPGRYVHSPMNVEGVFALAFVALLLLSSGSGYEIESVPSASYARLAIILGTAVILGFAGYLNFPLLADDYSHIWAARHADARALWAHVVSPDPDRFFRPVGYASYALEARWAGLAPLPWRSANLALHVANTLLVFRLCTELGLKRTGAFLGALIFGLHGSRPEAVTWVAARFDLLAVLFGVGCLIAIVRDAGLAVVGLLLAAALLSKESAYVLPFLAAALLRYRGREWKSIARGVAPLVAIEAVAFAYQLYLLGGIGGYRNAANGSPTIFNFGIASSLKALLPRFWAVLLFPLNWTDGLSRPVAVAICLSLAALCYLAWRGADRRTVELGVCFATICSLPVHQFLSIGPDLEKSRVVYFASVGLALIFAAVFERLSPGMLVAAVGVVAFQAFALENNLAIWKRVGLLAERTCRVVMPARVEGLPNVVDGVYFLHTGFPECLLFQHADAPQGPGYAVYAWNASSRTLERK